MIYLRIPFDKLVAYYYERELKKDVKFIDYSYDAQKYEVVIELMLLNKPDDSIIIK